MGANGHYPYPKWVWSPIGGWWPEPRNWKRNAAIQGVGAAFLVYQTFKLSARKEQRLNYPDRWIPSMLWARDFHDPVYVKFWKKQLEKEGREWIEPYPEWYPEWLKATYE